MIWGVGYGAVPKRVKNYSAIVTEGVPNIDTYGNFTPTSEWLTQASSGYGTYLYIRHNSGEPIQFENPCKTRHNTLVIKGYTSQNCSLYLGSTAGGNDYYNQRLQAKSKVDDKQYVSLENIPVPFYISFYDNITSPQPCANSIYLTDDE